MLPGNSRVGGFWPAFWTMGNLGRPGYGATTDGTWPYVDLPHVMLNEIPWLMHDNGDVKADPSQVLV